MPEGIKAKNDKKILRVMPNNIEAEECVLGAILIDDKAADEIIPILKEEDFYVTANRIIFGAMVALQESSKPIDMVSVADKLELMGKLDEVGSIAYLSSLSETVPSAANAATYASIIKRDSLTRKVIHAGNEIVEYAYSCTDGKDALDKAEQLIYKISEENSVKALVHASEALAIAMKNIQAAQSGDVPKNIIYTGFPEFDKLTKGLKPGQFIIIAARPSVGKTALALNFATNVVLKGKTVAIFNMEMAAPDLVKRQLAYLSNVTFDSMDNRGQLSDEDSGKLFNSYNSLLSTNLYIDDYSLNRPMDILSKCRRLKREKGLDVVIVDYLQLMEAESRGRASDSRQNDVSDMSRKLKVFARELGVPIIALSQMSRDVEKDKGRQPQLSDLRDSGAIEQDADIVAFLHDPNSGVTNPDGTPVPHDEIVMFIRKNRSGNKGDIKMKFIGATTTFREINENGEESATPAAPATGGGEMKIIPGAALPFGETASDTASHDIDDDDKEYVDNDGAPEETEDIPF